MTHGNSVRVLIITASVAALLAGAAWASGGGSGGGMGSTMPSASGPQYNPVEEHQKGVEALKAQQYKVAISHFNRVIDVAPKDSGTWTLMGLAKEGAGDAKGARSAYEKAVRYNGDNITAHQLLGVAEAKAGDTAKTQAELADLQKRDAACAGSCPKNDELKAAIAALQAALDGGAATDTPKASLLFNSPAGGDRAYVEAVALINAGRYEDALQSLHKSELAFGPHPDILTYEGYANRKLHRYDQAEAYYTEALAVDPTHVGATEYYGELKVERGDIAGAKKLLARLDAICTFGCSEQEELRGWIDQAPHSQHGS
ncbi:MAG TPA: tetratricopeptide repeat protein [Caulobacteraceae bacterium]|jgi:Flp pilus assembly protein TadD